MFFNLLLFVVSVGIFWPLKPSETLCSNGQTYHSILLDFARNVQDACQTETATIRFVQKRAPYSCCAFNLTTCKNVRDVYEYFYTEKEKNPSAHNLCYYNVFLLFFVLCDCKAKIHKGPPAKDLSCGVSGLYSGRASSIVPYIIGGQKSIQCEYPWMVHYDLGDHLCGGVLIDTKHVLTAAHCASLGNKQQKISLSTTDIFNPTFEAEIEKVTIHPQYHVNRIGFYNDIAILKLSGEVPLAKCIQPICLPDLDHTIHDTTNCFIAGWGRNASGFLQRYLQKVKIPILSESICRKYIPGYRPGHLCAGYLQGGKDSCAGDSGGPLMCPVKNGQWVLAGITSFGTDCAIPYHPGIYTDVKYYMNWILNNLY